MQITEEKIKSLVSEAFQKAWKHKEDASTNSKRSAYFVSELSRIFINEFGGEALVQTTDKSGIKSPGEWLLDIVIVSKTKVRTDYKNRESEIVDTIHWAIESEFSTQLNEFCKDFAKLLHVKSENYLYIAGLNQVTMPSREQFIVAQSELAQSLVVHHGISEPFYLVFLPTPGKSGEHSSLWNSFGITELMSWVKVFKLSPAIVEECT